MKQNNVKCQILSILMCMINTTSLNVIKCRQMNRLYYNPQTVLGQMLLYADKWLDYTRTIHIALKMLKNERWLFKDNKLL